MPTSLDYKSSKDGFLNKYVRIIFIIVYYQDKDRENVLFVINSFGQNRKHIEPPHGESNGLVNQSFNLKHSHLFLLDNLVVEKYSLARTVRSF